MPVHEIRHPLIQHKLGYLRNQTTPPPLFRKNVSEIAGLLAYEALTDLDSQTANVPSWSGMQTVQRIESWRVVLCPVLRAGIGMLDGVQAMFPSAGVSTIGLERDETTLEATAYYEKHAAYHDGAVVLLLDPMLATGGTAAAAAARLRAMGVSKLRALFLIAAPEGIHYLEDADPEIEIYTAAVDDRLDERGFILPGLGDAGDRIFGTP